jgi:hypothetical protein
MSWSANDLKNERRRDQEKRDSQNLRPLLAPKCQCAKPFFYRDDDIVQCIVCGKRP